MTEQEQQLPPFEKEMRASLGADHMQPVDAPALKLPMTPAPREAVTDEECEDFVRQAWKRANQTDEGDAYEFRYWHNAVIVDSELAIARYALESRAPQTAPRDPITVVPSSAMQEPTAGRMRIEKTP